MKDMKDTMHKIFSLLALVSIALLVGCEGPAGTDGMDANESCIQCHSPSSSSALKAKTAQFEMSAHALGTYFDRGGECAACHSTQGFLAHNDYATIADIAGADLGEQTPIGCETCHTIHQAYDSTDWALTIVEPVTATLLGSASPEVDQIALGDIGVSNMCLNCHQARDRGNIPSLTSTDDVSTNSHWGPHYGVQGNVLNASGGVALAGSESYPTAPNGHANLDNACIACHMSEGSHTLAVNYDACSTCHEDAEGLVEELEGEVHDLLYELGAILAEQGAMSGDDEAGYSPRSGSISADQARGVWNYMVVYSDHSYGTHNPSYIKALLTNTIESLQ
jgi:hypothetical protein